MKTFFGALYDIISDVVDANYNEQKRLGELDKARRLERERKREERKIAEYKMWQDATAEALKDPEEWMVLPYGWSPFGIFL